MGSSWFGFSDRQTLVLHAGWKNKPDVLLATMHNDNKIDEITGLPKMMQNCNAIKPAVDPVD